MVYKEQTIANALIWTTFGVWISINFSNQLQLTCCNLNLEHISTMPCYIMHLDCALQCNAYFVVVPVFALFARLKWKRNRNRRPPPSLKTPYRTSSARQANPHWSCYKILLPSQSRLCMFRRSPRHVLSHSWTHSDAWPIILSPY